MLSMISTLILYIFLDLLSNIVTTFIISYCSGELGTYKTFQKDMLSTLKKLILPSFIDGFFGAILITIEMSYPGKFSKLQHTSTLSYWTFVSIVLYFILADFFFYCLHRFIFHNEYLYKTFHALHHSYKNPKSFYTRIAEPIEGIATVFCFFLPAYFVELPFHLFYVLLMMTQIYTIWLHTESSVSTQPQLPKSFLWKNILMEQKVHRTHHFYGQVNFNYGVFFQFWDRVLGTYKDPTVPLTS